MVLSRETKRMLAHPPVSIASGEELYFLMKSAGTLLVQAVCE